MARLPTVGSDSGNWGDVLNTFLLVSHTADGEINLESWADSGSRPTTPVSGQIGINLSTNEIERYDGTSWTGVSPWTGKTVPSGSVVGTTDAQTLTNKRIGPRVVGLTDAATVTINADTTDQGNLLTLSQTTTIANPTGTPTDGQLLFIRIKSTTSRTLSFGSQFRASLTVSLPTTTQGSSLTEYYSFIWNNTDSKWDILTVNIGF